jgi:uncharacterized membrane protein
MSLKLISIKKEVGIMWWDHHGFHPFFGILFFILIIGIFFSLRFLMWRRFHGSCFHNGEDALSLLKKRLVNGEINEEEYLRIKEVLKK